VIRVAIADDHAVVRTGLKVLLDREPDLEPVGEAATAQEAIRLARDTRPDVILLDVTMPGRSGIDAIHDLLRMAPDTRVLILSMQDDPTYVRQAFSQGARGYVLKDAADSELAQAIRRVAAGEQYVHPSLGARLVVAPEEEAANEDPLSEREREVLSLLAFGYTNQEIAEKLVVSVRTVEAHRAHILRKLGLATRADLVRYAINAGLLQGD
jgi:two-component system, NarL family, response regulator NreC